MPPANAPHLCAAESATHASGTEPVLAATHASSEPEPAATQACTDPEPAAQSPHPDFPTLGVSNAPVFKFFRVLSDELILLGPHAGSYKATYECTIPTEGGGACGAQRTIYHKLRSCVCNSNLIKHIAQVGTYDDRHDDALRIHQSSSKKSARRRASASATKNLTAGVTRLYQKASESMMR